jgi:hypothetical protein
MRRKLIVHQAYRSGTVKILIIPTQISTGSSAQQLIVKVMEQSISKI